MSKLNDLAELGQSVWLDYVRRTFLESDEFQTLVDQGLLGLTSNPSIFEKAISGSSDYDEQLHILADTGASNMEIYEALAIEDIRLASDALSGVFESTSGHDGYVSLEVRPELAHDWEGTVEEAQRLYATIGRPNVMIKVPATSEGIRAVEALIAAGVNVNVTLIFSLRHYEGVVEAYLSGLERLAESGGDVSRVASVASFFISRLDSSVDQLLEERGVVDLKGKIAIANAKAAHARFVAIHTEDRWKELAEQGAKVQRLLWASTSTKNPHYPDTMYVDELIGSETVNTIPPATLRAFMDHGDVAPRLDEDVEEALGYLRRLHEIGIDLGVVTQNLQDEGLKAFAVAFESILESISQKRERLESGWKHYESWISEYQVFVDRALQELTAEDVIARIWNHDHTVWKDNPIEISNRLGWLHIAEAMLADVERLETFVESVRIDEYTHAVLLGMGGSSLAPEVFRRTFGVGYGYLDLTVLDSTDPDAVLTVRESLDLEHTLFIVATKSGGTVETLSLFKYFYNEVVAQLGKDQAGEHFVAITDPGTQLVGLADRYKFRSIFQNDPNIGGRYSALSYFGLVPAALLGVNLRKLLDSALTATYSCDSCLHVNENPGAVLGVILGELAKEGRDKATFIISHTIASFGDWVEQLIAESTGKEGNGILPVVGEPIGSMTEYGKDRFFIYIRLEGQGDFDNHIEELYKSGHPVVQVRIHDLYDLGGQFFIWEMATAVASQRLNVNPFDQPNVEAAKVLAREMVDVYQSTGSIPTEVPSLRDEDISVYVDSKSAEGLERHTNWGIDDVLREFLMAAQEGGYISIHAYVEPTLKTSASLLTLRMNLREKTGLAVTTGYGPRFLHSTGQLHKGDRGKGLFIQITAENMTDVPIPNEAGETASSISFGILKDSQALGDRQALLDEGRRVLRFDLGTDVISGLDRINRLI
ncbi:MAG: bifunctional transaldolase/phosoglucose isomerase [Anaerolineales bacterium]|nr:bifunctional transaldolase/phosoglucose isomerase [Anaerolineales bacterium]